MADTSIEWTELTWNPTTGCTKLSAGCKYCYAELMSKRLKAMGIKKYSEGFNVRMHPDTLNIPYTWKSSKNVFVNSMSDLFHEDIPLDFIKKVFNVMIDNPNHVFQILTKRADRLFSVQSQLKWTHNIWMGVTVEDAENVARIDLLRKTNARIKFLSCEPLLTSLPNLNLEGIDWVIVGGESGAKARTIKSEWVEDIQKQCENSGVAFFFKQWGGKRKKQNGRLLNGQIYDGMPQIMDI
jgi:protein gp37